MGFISMPKGIVAAQVIDLKTSMDRILRLMRRWSCSKWLLRYWLRRMRIGFSVRGERFCNRLSPLQAMDRPRWSGYRR
jgi:hypothetical protein